MVITASHTTRPLTEDEYRDLTLIKETDNCIEKCQSYHGNKMKVGDSTVPKVETVSDDDDADKYNHTYFPDIPEEKITMTEQDIIDNKGNPIDGLDHIVDNYINMEVLLPFGEKELYEQVVRLFLSKN